MSKKLPENPDLDQLKAQAKELLKAARSGDGEAVVRLENYQLRAEGKRLMLADAQLVVSREYGYSSWRKLKNHVDHIRGDRPTPLETNTTRIRLMSTPESGQDLRGYAASKRRAAPSFGETVLVVV